MKIRNTSYRGMAPRITPRALPEGAAQEAINCRLKRGDIEPWRQFAETQALSGITNPATIFRLKATTWLAFSQQTDIARPAVTGGLDNRVLLTCPGLYPTPRYTDFVAATAGSPPFPVTTYPLGVPAPEDPPGIELGVDSTPTTFSIDVLDEGDVLSSDWTISASAGGGGTFTAVHQDASGGNPDECYRLQYDEVHANSQGPYAFRDFGVGTAAVITASTDFQFVEDDDVQRRAGLSVACTIDGAGVVAHVYSGNTLRIAVQSEWSGWFGAATISAVSCGLAHSVWYRLQVDLILKPDGTQDITATVFQGATQIATVHGVGTAEVGNFVGISAVSEADANPRYATRFDNIHVQASGSTGIVPNLTAVNYVYTYVNDLGEEGAPSFPTQDVLRPDGVTVTVTTLTSAPVVDSVTYTRVTNKRIYRLVSGTTGDVYRLVAEIALATATFVDDLPDNELPQTLLESEDFDLPHPDMEGIITLPNGLNAGFFENQLCISATGWAHAWPVRQRLRVDSAIVAINNIDNTIVVGTKTFVYTATGNDGASYSMSKPGASQSCTSKLGMVFLDGQGVVFPSPDGWCVCAGSAGNVPVVSEGIFTKEQWQAYDPTSIIAAVHDNVLHWYWETVEVTEEQVFSIQFENFSAAQPLDLSFQTTWPTAVPLTAATFASWNSGTGQIDITQSGVYEVTFSAQFDSTTIESYESCLGAGPYGAASSKYPNSSGISAHHREASAQSPTHEQIADVWLLNVAATDSFFPMVYGKAEQTTPGFFSTLIVTVSRLGASVAP